MSCLPVHEYNLSKLEIRPSGTQIEVYAKLDRLDLLTAIQITCEDYNHLAQCFETYFQAHTQFVFDGMKVIPEHKNHVFTKDFIELYFTLAKDPRQVGRLEIQNELLYEISLKQQNILFSKLHNKNRSFRMDKDRLKVEIVY